MLCWPRVLITHSTYLYGDGLITFDANALVDNGMVSNLGEIYANGGHVLMTAQAADTVLESLISVDGYIEATTVSEQEGKVVLQGYDNSHIKIAGTINVSGTDAGEVGGIVQASANYIQLLDGSSINAQGYNGGGTVHLGSDQFHNPADDPTLNTFGLPTELRTAEYLYMADGSTIYADAITDGIGGDVVLWADKATWFYGDISAKGGSIAGDGGRVETSGYEYLAAIGRVNASATNGAAGLWLLDPASVTIDNATTSNGSFDGGNPNTFTTSANTAVADVNTIESSLAGGTSVTITTAPGGTEDPANLTVASSINPDRTNRTAGDATLTLNATDNIFINAIIDTFNDTPTYNLTLTAGGTITQTAAIDVYDFTQTSGTFTTNANGGTLPGFQVRNDFTVSGGSFQRFADGDGLTSNSAFEIVDYYGLQSMAYDLDAFYELSNNIDGIVANTINVAAWNNNLGFKPIGATGTEFTGQFDFNDNTLTDFTIARPQTDKIGLFGVVSGGTIIDPNFSEIDVSGRREVGILAARMENGSTLTINGTSTLVDTDGDVDLLAASVSSTNTGGLVGIFLNSTLDGGGTLALDGLTIQDSVDNQLTLGGLFGKMENSTVELAAMTSTDLTLIPGGNINSIGSLIGDVSGGTVDVATLSADNTSMTDAVSSTGGVGGLIGTLSGTLTATTLQVTNSTISNAEKAGGLFGQVGADITATTATVSNTTISVSGIAGGIMASTVGTRAFNMGSVTVSANSSVTADGSAGGFSATAGTINFLGTTFVNNASVTGTSSTGGVIGLVSGNLTNLTATNNGAVSSSVNDGIGGIFGLLSGGTTNAASSLTNNGDVTSTATGTSLSHGLGGIVGRMLSSAILDGTLTVGDGSALSINTTGDGGALGYVAGGVWTGADIKSTNITVGSNVSFAGLDNTITGVGGIAGVLLGGTLLGFNTSTWEIPTVDGGTANDVGGVVGVIAFGTYSGDLSSLANVSGGNHVGGVIGAIGADGIGGTLDTNTFANTHTVTGTTGVGGVIGTVYNNSTINDTVRASNSGTITGTTDVGGIVGSIDSNATFSTLDQAYNNANNTVTGGLNVGGIVGRLATNNTVSNAQFGGTVSGSNSNIGGIVGNNAGTVDASLGIGTISGAGGNKGVLVGNNAGTLSNSVFDSRINSGLAAVGTGNDMGYTAASSGFDAEGTYVGFAFPPWQTNGSDKYASPAWCGPGCAVSVFVTPAPGFPGNITFGIENSQRILETTDEIKGADVNAYDVIFFARMTEVIDYLPNELFKVVGMDEVQQMLLAGVNKYEVMEDNLIVKSEAERNQPSFYDVIDSLIKYYQ